MGNTAQLIIDLRDNMHQLCRLDYGSPCVLPFSHSSDALVVENCQSYQSNNSLLFSLPVSINIKQSKTKIKTKEKLSSHVC